MMAGPYQPLSAPVPAPVVVVSPQFCSPDVPLTVTKKVASLSGGDFTVTDANGAVELQVKGSFFTVRNRRVLLDAAGQPVLSMHEKAAIFIFGAWAGASNGGVLVGLAACGVMMSIVSMAADLMQDFKTGYLTLALPRSMFISQVIGTAMGCVIAPSVFWLFYMAFTDIGISGSEYPAPYAIVYRNMAILGVDGFSSLPKNCLTLCYIFFVAAIVVNLIRDLVPKKVARFIPLPMAMAIPFYIGSYFAIDMFVGTVILFAWQMINRAKADAFRPAVASGLIYGDGIWTLPKSIVSLAKVKPPICMKFLSRSVNAQVDGFLGN